MSVDYKAKIMYGWFIEQDTVYDYKEANREKYDYNDYLHCISSWGNSDYIYGIAIYDTDYAKFIDPDILTDECWEEDEDWKGCVECFKEDFPDMYANIKPGFFLVQNVW